MYIYTLQINIYACTYTHINIHMFLFVQYMSSSPLLQKRKEALKSSSLLFLQSHLSSLLCLLNIGTNQVTLFDNLIF